MTRHWREIKRCGGLHMCASEKELLRLVNGFEGLSGVWRARLGFFGWHVSTPDLLFVRYYTLFIFPRQMLLICTLNCKLFKNRWENRLVWGSAVKLTKSIMQPVYALSCAHAWQCKPTRHSVPPFTRHLTLFLPFTLPCAQLFENSQSRWMVYSFEMRQSEIALGLRKNSLIQVSKFLSFAINFLLTWLPGDARARRFSLSWSMAICATLTAFEVTAPTLFLCSTGAFDD